MMVPVPANEGERIAVLKEYRVLDTGSEQVFDDITRLVAYICRVPMATISLVDSERQWFKSRLGLEVEQTAREISFCAHTILQPKPLIVRDALRDARFAESPLVQSEPHIRFYAGFPLISPEGTTVGTVCAMDKKPRRLTTGQQLAMEALAREAVELLELRRVSGRLAEALEHVKTLHGLLPICAWCKRIRDDHGYWTKVEAYIQANTEADFTHGICPTCLEKQKPKKKPSNYSAA